MSWILVTYKLPPNSSRARVAVWREVRRSGALHLQQSVVAFPDCERFRPVLGRFRDLVAEVGGETLALRADPIDDDGERLVAAWNEARDSEYGELISTSGRFLTEIDHEFAIAKFTLAELEEEEAELEKLQSWHERVAGRDVHGASRGEAAQAALRDAAAALARFSDAVYEQTRP